jgi:hypothetical protein
MSKFLGLAVAVLLAAGLCGVVCATEGGGGAYPNGAEDFMSGALPPPGRYFIDYLLYYTADELMDHHGDELPVDLDLQVLANVFRFVNVTKTQVFGASWAQHIFVPVMRADLEIMGMDDDVTGLGDIIVDPFILGWHGKNWHCTAGVDVYMPTGKYDEDDLVNVGRNCWTIEPVAAFTAMLPGNLEASAKFMYDINMENPDTDYKSGDEFHFDYTVGMRVQPALAVGVGGFYYQQVGEDELDGEELEDREGKVWAWGPQMAYSVKNMNFVLKYQMEQDAENRPEGEQFWLKFIMGL